MYPKFEFNTTSTTMIIFGLGTNLGDREQNLERAIELIDSSFAKVVAKSEIISTPPMLPENAPEDWDIDFLNMAIATELNKELTPQQVLKEIKDIEVKIGRKESPRWAPREIDIDILAWDNLIFEEDKLQIPHPGLTERAFAILPLAEIAPDWVHPKTGIAASEYAKQFRS